MRIIKLALISAVVLSIIILLFSLLIPSTIRVSRAIDISVPADSLRRVVTDLQQWPRWNEMVSDSLNANKQISENKIASEHLVIEKQSSAADTLITVWRHPNGRYFTSGMVWHSGNERLVLQWYFDIKLRWYPWEKFSGIIFDKQLGPPMEKSLATLKKLLENNP